MLPYWFSREHVQREYGPANASGVGLEGWKSDPAKFGTDPTRLGHTYTLVNIIQHRLGVVGHEKVYQSGTLRCHANCWHRRVQVSVRGKQKARTSNVPYVKIDLSSWSHYTSEALVRHQRSTPLFCHPCCTFPAFTHSQYICSGLCNPIQLTMNSLALQNRRQTACRQTVARMA
jgi:hypothetical protein